MINLSVTRWHETNFQVTAEYFIILDAVRIIPDGPSLYERHILDMLCRLRYYDREL